MQRGIGRASDHLVVCRAGVPSGVLPNGVLLGAVLPNLPRQAGGRQRADRLRGLSMVCLWWLWARALVLTGVLACHVPASPKFGQQNAGSQGISE